LYVDSYAELLSRMNHSLWRRSGRRRAARGRAAAGLRSLCTARRENCALYAQLGRPQENVEQASPIEIIESAKGADQHSSLLGALLEESIFRFESGGVWTRKLRRPAAPERLVTMLNEVRKTKKSRSSLILRAGG
jgi:hypothetical protein